MTTTGLTQDNFNKKDKFFIFCRIIAITIGIFLLFSALAKTQPISSFISTIYSHFPLQFTYVTLLAQFIVSLEAALGVMLIMGLNGWKRWVLWVTNILFIVFTIFVVYIWRKDGENADCGCLGEWVKLSPVATLIKNIILIFLTTFLLIKFKPIESKSRHIFTYVILVILFFYTFLFYPAELQVDRLYNDENSKPLPTLSDGTQPDLRSGQYILCFMSYSCKYCKSAAKIISEIYEKNKTLPIIFIFSEKSKENIEGHELFFAELPYKEIPILYMNTDDFAYLAGKGVPSIYLISDMVIDKKIDDYTTISEEKFVEWFNDSKK